MKGVKLVLALIVILLFIKCGLTAKRLDTQALSEFKTEFPKAAVAEQFVGEGDSDHAYMHFRYSEPGTTEKKEVMWLYQKRNDGSWYAIHKSTPKAPGSDFGG